MQYRWGPGESGTDQDLQVIRRVLIPAWLKARIIPEYAGKVVGIRVGSDSVSVAVRFSSGLEIEKAVPFSRDPKVGALIALIDRVARAVISAAHAATVDAFSRMVIEPEEWTTAA